MEKSFCCMVESSAILLGHFFHLFVGGLVVALWFSSICFLQSEGPTVEGRNPAPVELGSLSQSSVFTRFYTSKVASYHYKFFNHSPTLIGIIQTGGGGGRWFGFSIIWVICQSLSWMKTIRKRLSWDDFLRVGSWLECS